MKYTKLLFSIFIMLMGTSSCAESRTVAETGDTLMQVIERRRSIRRYTGEKISRQVLEQIVGVEPLLRHPTARTLLSSL